MFIFYTLYRNKKNQTDGTYNTLIKNRGNI